MLISLPPPPRRPLEVERKGEPTIERLGTVVAALVPASYMRPLSLWAAATMAALRPAIL
jgi:hypothetical protein